MSVSRYRVTSPTARSGIVAGVRMVRGVVEVDERDAPGALAYFRRRGYRVEPLVDDPAPGDVDQAPIVVERPARRAPVAAWRAYAVALGADADQVERMTKAELIDRYGGDQ